MDYKNLKKFHPQVYGILRQEQKRQKSVINLIASENYVSDAVLEALGTEFTNKYAEGKSGQRYYFGNRHIDELEDYTKGLALKIFKLSAKKWNANVQPYSGSGANFAVYTALVKPGGTILAMSLQHGGHLTHGHPVSATGKFWNFVHYGVGPDGRIDYDQILALAKKHKPELIVCGGSAYSRQIDFKKIAAIAQKVGAQTLADISHIAGLIAGGVHPSPFPHVDVVTTTTHKTLRGPRAAVIYTHRELAESIDKAIFPGLQGGPHMNTIAAMAVALEEALSPKFKSYIRQVVKNAKVLAEELKKSGLRIMSDGTDNHLLLVDLTSLNISGKKAGEMLEQAGIVVNKNAIPHDSRKPWDPSGIRLGTAAVTTQGLKEKDMRQIAQRIVKILKK